MKRDGRAFVACASFTGKGSAFSARWYEAFSRARLSLKIGRMPRLKREAVARRLLVSSRKMIECHSDSEGRMCAEGSEQTGTTLMNQKRTMGTDEDAHWCPVDHSRSDARFFRRRLISSCASSSGEQLKP